LYVAVKTNTPKAEKNMDPIILMILNLLPIPVGAPLKNALMLRASFGKNHITVFGLPNRLILRVQGRTLNSIFNTGEKCALF